MDRKHKVAVLVGSLSKASLNRKMAKALVAVAPASLELYFVEIGDLPLYTPDFEADPPRRCGAFRERVAQSDALLFVTPEYNRSIPGALKNAIDVGSRPDGKSVWADKPAAVVQRFARRHRRVRRQPPPAPDVRLPRRPSDAATRGLHRRRGEAVRRARRPRQRLDPRVHHEIHAGVRVVDRARPLEPLSTDLARDVARRRTFAIISHPDAGKTTLTEKLLLFGGAIQMAGTVKARKSSRHATSDWMEVEKQRGISVTSSVMQFDYAGHTINLLDTPGHQDFSEDTYRVLTAVDAAVMVIDAAKGVEEQTIKLLEVCRLRSTPIITFVNKMDREVREPFALQEEIEAVLKIDCAPVSWPARHGQALPRRVRPAARPAEALHAGRGARVRRCRGDRGPATIRASTSSFRRRWRRCGTTSS